MLQQWTCPALPQLHRGQSAVRQGLPYWLTMTPLLDHSKGQLTECRFLPQKLILQNTSDLPWSDLIIKSQKITKLWFSKSIFYLKNPINHSEFDFLSKMLDYREKIYRNHIIVILTSIFGKTLLPKIGLFLSTNTQFNPSPTKKLFEHSAVWCTWFQWWFLITTYQSDITRTTFS